MEEEIIMWINNLQSSFDNSSKKLKFLEFRLEI